MSDTTMPAIDTAPASTNRQDRPRRPSMRNLIQPYRATLFVITVLSGGINLLALTSAVYVLQLYDVLMPAQMIENLGLLMLVGAGLYILQNTLRTIRAFVFSRMGADFESKLLPLVLRVAMDMPRYGYSRDEAKDRDEDVAILRRFVNGPGLQTLCDLVWVPLFVLFIYYLHPKLALLAVVGSLLLAVLSIIKSNTNKSLGAAAQDAQMERDASVRSHINNADAVRAMGLADAIIAQYQKIMSRAVNQQHRANWFSAAVTAMVEATRAVLMIVLMGLAAYYYMHGEASLGAVVAVVFAAVKVSTPLEQIIYNWQGFIIARRSFRRLDETIKYVTANDKEKPDLPPVKETLSVEHVSIAAPKTAQMVLLDISFELKAGQVLALIGQTGGGKSSLLRALAGIWPLERGSVSLDHINLATCSIAGVGRQIGYLPQDPTLFDGTIAQNIARLDPECEAAALSGEVPEKVLAAARQAGIDDMIGGLPNGYHTQILQNGYRYRFSAEQRQRLALAQALYGEPFLVLLDEPDSNLGADGDKALIDAILALKRRGAIVVMALRRPLLLRVCDLVGIVHLGRLTDIGPKDDVLKRNSPDDPDEPA